MIMQIFAEKIADTLASLHFPWKERVSSSVTFMLLQKFDLIGTILHNETSRNEISFSQYIPTFVVASPAVGAALEHNLIISMTKTNI